MSAVAQPRSPVPGWVRSQVRRARRASHGNPAPIWSWVMASVVLAVLSWVLLPTIPSYDPFSWIDWGREVTDPHLAFTISDGPSWKPLPFLFTTVYGLCGSAAPTLWVITARVGGLLGLAGALTLAARLVRVAGGGRWAAAAAGLLAAAGILLTPDFGYYLFRGASEPGLVACTLWAIERLLAGRRGTAFGLALAAALIRPEWWPFLGADAVWLAIRDPAWRGWGRRLFLLAGLALVPLLWFGPPWVASGTPLLAAIHAREYDGQLGSDPLRAVVGRAVDDQPWPLLAAAVGLVAVVGAAVVRRRGPAGRSRTVLALAAGALAWCLLVILMTLLGSFPGLQRFFLPATAVICVLGGVGLVTFARWLGRRWRAALGGATAAHRRLGRAAPAIVLAVLVAGSAAVTWTPISRFAQSEGQAALAVRTLHGMEHAIAAAGGRARILPCATSFVAVNHSAQPALAWDLRAPLASVGTAMRRPGLDFIGPANISTGVEAAIAPRLVRGPRVARVGRWSVVVWRSRRRSRADRCIGS